MRFDFLDALGEDWQPVAKLALREWAAFYGLFLVYALTRRDDSFRNFLFADYIVLPTHDGRPLVFGWFGSGSRPSG